MEVFSLLKYWRTSAGAISESTSIRPTATTTGSTTTTTIRHVAADDSDDENEDDNNDDGPFFDLEFAVPVDDVGEQECDVSEDTEEEEDDAESVEDQEAELDFTVDSSCSTGNRTDPNLSLSPSDDLFFNSRFVPLEPSELGFNSTESHSKLQFPTAILKPATKLRVLMLGFKKPKSAEKIETRTCPPKPFTVKFKVEEVPIVSLFTRENSSRNQKTKLQSTQQSNEEIAASDDKKFAKDVLQKYFNMVKPLYFKVSKKCEKSSGFSGQLNLNCNSPISSPTKKIDTEIKETEVNVGCVRSSQKEGNLTAGLRNVRKQFGKSRSASSAVAAVPSSIQSRRHDDSLLQQQDGIQSAILHCKRSFTASRDSDSDSSELSRCASDPTHEKSTKSAANSSRNSLDETKSRNVSM